MVLPAINGQLALHGSETLEYFDLANGNVVSMYFIYLLIGYGLGKGMLEKWSIWPVIGGAVVTFGLCAAVQLYGYAQPADYLVDYSFPLLPICGGFLFELIRRSPKTLRALEPGFRYLSSISFGIFFAHIGIMTALVKLTGDWNMIRPVRVMLYQAVSLLGSVAVIWPLSRVRFLRKYLFLIKDR